MSGIPCKLAACKGVNATQRYELEKEDTVGLGNVAATSKKFQKPDGPLPFLRNASTKLGSGAEIQPQKRRAAPTYCPMEKIYHEEKREEIDLTVAFFFYLNFIFFNVACSPFFIDMYRNLV